MSDDKVRIIRFVDTDDNFIDNMEEKETNFTEAFKEMDIRIKTYIENEI